jgi:hypothetical protein
VAASPASFTGRYLKPHLRTQPQVRKPTGLHESRDGSHFLTCAILAGVTPLQEDCMSIKSIFQSTVAALAFVAAGPLFAQGTPINAAAFDALVAQGPVADAATIASSPWASKIKQAGTLRLGGTHLESLLAAQRKRRQDARLRRWLGPAHRALHPGRWGQDPVHAGDLVHARAGAHQRPGGHGAGHLLHHPRPRREDLVRRPYYTSQAGVLVKANNKAIQSYNDLAGKKVATQAGSTGLRSWRSTRPRRSCKSSRRTRKPSTRCARAAWTPT